MGIWIRSQDGGLGQYSKFLPPVINYEEIPDPDSIVPIRTNKVLNARIYGCDMYGGVDILGTYNSETEALDVLSEIERHITELHLLPIQGHANFKYGPVFEMPAAGFSVKPEKFYPDCEAEISSCDYAHGSEFIAPEPKGNDLVVRCASYNKCKAAWDRGCR